MTNLHASIAAVLAVLLVLTLNGQHTSAAADHPTAVVGTFDSRAVAVAYIRSAAFSEYVSAQKADIDRALERARAAGDTRLVADLDALGPAMQTRVHQQGFGTAPVDDIIARIRGDLPAIAKAAGVDVIVSKWALAYRDPAARFVDVTDLLVAKFDPNEATLKVIQELRRSEPIPHDQLMDPKG